MLRNALRSVLRRAGLEVRRAAPAEFEWLSQLGIDTVLDIGANTGQFARFIRRILPDAAIVSFEPLPDCCQQLAHNMRSDRRFQAVNLALSDRTGRLPFRRSSYSPSSSLIPMHPLHRELFPHTAGEVVTEVNATTLDAAAADLDIGSRLLVKMDVQGAEPAVIRGGAGTIRRACVVILPCTFIELYAGQSLFPDDFAKLTELGFRYFGSIATMKSPRNGLHLSEDAVFIREDLVADLLPG